MHGFQGRLAGSQQCLCKCTDVANTQMTTQSAFLPPPLGPQSTSYSHLSDQRRSLWFSWSWRGFSFQAQRPRPTAESSLPSRKSHCDSQRRECTGTQVVAHSVREVKLPAKGPQHRGQSGLCQDHLPGRTNAGDPGGEDPGECLSFRFIEGWSEALCNKSKHSAFAKHLICSLEFQTASKTNKQNKVLSHVYMYCSSKQSL